MHGHKEELWDWLYGHAQFSGLVARLQELIVRPNPLY